MNRIEYQSTSTLISRKSEGTLPPTGDDNLKVLEPSKKLTVFLLGITIVVIALGGLIRINDAGESCPDWPTCFGTWGFDISADEQGEWWGDNPDEVDSRGSAHRYTTFQIFTEWVHRFLAGAILGPLVLVNWFILNRSNNTSGEVTLASTVSVILILWQGGIGWLTVELDNLHWSVGLHLSSALIFTLSLVWLWFAISKAGGGLPAWISFDEEESRRWFLWLAFLTVGAFLSIFSGTFVSTQEGANQGCGVDGFPLSWPLCEGDLIKPVDDILAQAKMVHRWFVGFVWVSLMAVSYVAHRESRGGGSGLFFSYFWVATVLYSLNALIGASYILTYDMEEGFFELLSLVHLMMASATFLVLATALLGCFISKDGE